MAVHYIPLAGNWQNQLSQVITHRIKEGDTIRVDRESQRHYVETTVRRFCGRDYLFFVESKEQIEAQEKKVTE